MSDNSVPLSMPYTLTSAREHPPSASLEAELWRFEIVDFTIPYRFDSLAPTDSSIESLIPQLFSVNGSKVAWILGTFVRHGSSSGGSLNCRSKMDIYGRTSVSASSGICPENHFVSRQTFNARHDRH